MSRLAGRLFVQVAASMAATLIGSTLITAMPNLAGWSSAPAVELTSGGKYATRIPGAEPQTLDGAAEPAARPRAPLPALTRQTEQVVLPSDTAADPAPKTTAAVDLSWDNGPAVQSLDKPVRVKPHGVRAADARRTEAVIVPRRPADAVLASTLKRSTISTGDVSAPMADDGIMARDGIVPKVVASARSLWSLTASTGGMIIDHLTP